MRMYFTMADDRGTFIECVPGDKCDRCGIRFLCATNREFFWDIMGKTNVTAKDVLIFMGNAQL